MEALLTLSDPQQSYSSTIFASSDDQVLPRWFIKRINFIAPNSTVFPDSSSFSKSIIDFIQKLNSFINLKDNWDSYGAIAPSVISIRNARRFLLRNAQVTLPFYFVSPGVNGEVMIELKKDNKAAEIYFLPDGVSELFLFENDHCVIEGNLKELFSALIRFFNESI